MKTKYYIGISLEGESIQKSFLDVTKYISKEYPHIYLKQNPDLHLTIIPPFQLDETKSDAYAEMTNLIQETAQKIASRSLVCEGFGHFNQRVLYLDIFDIHDLVLETRRELLTSLVLVAPGVSLMSSEFVNPHVTIYKQDESIPSMRHLLQSLRRVFTFEHQVLVKEITLFEKPEGNHTVFPLAAS